MKRILIQIYDTNEIFYSDYDQTTTPILLAKLIQDANYYENFNLSEIFYFQIKNTQYYFADRNTPIYKYLSHIDKPSLIFYKGLKGQMLLEKCSGVETSNIFNNNLNIKQQQGIQIGGESFNTLYSNQQQQIFQLQSQQTNQKKFKIVEIQPYDQAIIPNLNKNQQSLRQTEGVYSQSVQPSYVQPQQNSNLYQKVYEKPFNSFDASRQFSGTVKSLINYGESFPRQDLNRNPSMLIYQHKSEQLQNQQMTPYQRQLQIEQIQAQMTPISFQKNKYQIIVDATTGQLEEIRKFLTDNHIHFTIQT